MSTLVTPADTVRHLRRRMAEVAADDARRAAALRVRLPEAVACLRDRHGVGAVWLFGSLAYGTCRADSDRILSEFESLDGFLGLVAAQSG